MNSHRTANEQYGVVSAYELGKDLASLWDERDVERFHTFNRVVNDVRSRVRAANGPEAARAFTLGVRRGLRERPVVA